MTTKMFCKVATDIHWNRGDPLHIDSGPFIEDEALDQVQDLVNEQVFDMARRTAGDICPVQIVHRQYDFHAEETD